jgi:lysosomal-associated membrane protein 1/2
MNSVNKYLYWSLILANQTVVIAYNNQNDYNKPDGYAYHCNREQTLNATNGAITVGKVQYEAFKNDNSKKFSNAKDCDSNVSPDIVPIAVGISLIALIVVVLIAYIVGRRRQQARGYLNIMWSN